MADHLILRLEGPLQAWGDVAMDPRRPTRAFPSRSGLAGLLASALGWRYRDADRTTALQDALRYAVREDRRPQLVVDYQTADLGRIGAQGWTRWGVERRGGGSAEGTQILWKHYLADGRFLVALALAGGAAVLPDGERLELDDLAAALHRPARPLFLGRKGCPPSVPLLHPDVAARVDALTPADALLKLPLAPDAGLRPSGLTSDEEVWVRLWYDAADGAPVALGSPAEVQDVWDRRDFRSNRFGGSRRMALSLVPREHFPAAQETAA